MVKAVNEIVSGFAGAVTVDLLLYVLAAVIEGQKEIIGCNVLYCILATIVPILTATTMVNDVHDLQCGKVCFFIGSFIGMIFSWTYLG